MYAHLALQNHNLLPHEFMSLPRREQVFLVASDLEAAERLKEQQKR